MEFYTLKDRGLRAGFIVVAAALFFFEERYAHSLGMPALPGGFLSLIYTVVAFGFIVTLPEVAFPLAAATGLYYLLAGFGWHAPW